MEQETSLYSIQVQGIRCTNCAQKIQTNLPSVDGVKTVNVNVLEEKVQVQIIQQRPDVIKDILDKLIELKFQILENPSQINLGSSEQKRDIHFKICLDNVQNQKINFENTQIYINLRNKLGIISHELVRIQAPIYQNNLFTSTNSNVNNNLYDFSHKLTVSYDTRVIKAREILKIFEINQQQPQLNESNQNDSSIINNIRWEIFNPHLQNFKTPTFSGENIHKKNLYWAAGLLILICLMTMVIPNIEGSEYLITFPSNFGIFTFYLIFMVVLVVLAVQKFGIGAYKAAYYNYKEYQLINMETLITIGTVSALIMFILQLVIFIFSGESQLHNSAHLLEYNEQMSSSSQMNMNSSASDNRDQMNMSDNDNNSLMRQSHQIVHLLHFLQGASVILCVITFGKYFENQAKKSIIMMTESIFPENQMLSNVILRQLEPKNRNFVIESERDLEISFVDKDDLIRVDANFKQSSENIQSSNQLAEKMSSIPVLTQNQESMRLLLDGIVVQIQTPLIVVDTICYGREQEMTLQVGDRIKSGAQIKSGRGIIQVENTLENSMIIQVSQQLNISKNNSESNQSGLNAIFQGLSQNFVIFIIILAFSTFCVWTLILYFGSDGSQQYINERQECTWCLPIQRAIAVLVASCPCALGLAIPSVIVITLNISMKHGLLLKNNAVFENGNKVKAVVFDQTGTLFTQVNEIQNIRFFLAQTHAANQSEGAHSDLNQEQTWQILSLIQRNFVHPLAQLLYQESLQKIGTSLFNTAFILQSTPVFVQDGVQANLLRKIDGKPFHAVIGNEALINRFLSENSSENGQNQIDENLSNEIKNAKQQGKTVILMAINRQVQLIMEIENRHNLRPESQDVINFLQKTQRKKVFLLSGDAQSTVEKIGYDLGVPSSNLFGDKHAEQKQQLLRDLRQTEGLETMMIGDGLNDILSIEEATVGVSINAKSRLNLLAADVVVLDENLWKIPILFKIVRTARTFIILNLIWAFLYNLFIIPVSAGVFYFNDFSISPAISSIAMSCSSIIVVVFSNFLRCVDFDLERNQSQVAGKQGLKNNEIQLSVSSSESNQKNSQKSNYLSFNPQNGI